MFFIYYFELIMQQLIRFPSQACMYIDLSCSLFYSLNLLKVIYVGLIDKPLCILASQTALLMSIRTCIEA